MKKRRSLRQFAAGTVLALLLLAGSAQAQLLFVSVSEAPPAEVLEFTPGGMSSVYSSNLVNPSALAFNSAGDLFVGGNESSKVYKFTPDGTQSTYANIGSKANPIGEAFDSAGNLYVSDYYSNSIYKITPGGGSVATFLSGLDGPEALTFDNASNLYVACQESGLIVQIMPNGTTNTFASGLSYPTGLAFNGNGVLFVCCSGSVIEIATNGTQSTFYSESEVSLYRITFDSEGNLYGVEGPPANEILKISPQGVPSFFAYTGTINEPAGLAFQPIPSIQAATTNGAFQLTVTMPSPCYTTIVQASPDLVNWTNICTNNPPFTFTDSVAASSRFYRAVLDTNFY